MNPCDIYAVERNATGVDSRGSENHRGTFFPVLDSRKRKIRGPWIRNGLYYVQMRVERENGSTKPVRIPLEATTVDAARKEAEDKRAENRKKVLHLPGFRPKFEALAQDYMASADFLRKKEGTRENEEQALARWTTHLGQHRIDWIKTSQLEDFRNKRIQGVSPPGPSIWIWSRSATPCPTRS